METNKNLYPNLTECFIGNMVSKEFCQKSFNIRIHLNISHPRCCCCCRCPMFVSLYKRLGVCVCVRFTPSVRVDFWQMLTQQKFIQPLIRKMCWGRAKKTEEETMNKRTTIYMMENQMTTKWIKMESEWNRWTEHCIQCVYRCANIVRAFRETAEKSSGDRKYRDRNTDEKWDPKRGQKLPSQSSDMAMKAATQDDDTKRKNKTI